MSIENISISIDPSPLVNIIKTVIRDEMQPTLYGNDNTLSQMINGEIDNSPRIKDRILSLVRENMETRLFEDAVSDIVSSNIERHVNDNINYEEIAQNIDASDVASYIRMSRLAAEINAADIASEISVSDVADELADKIQSDLDYTEIANNIQLADLASEIDVETLMDKIDYRKLAKALLAEFASAKTNA